MAIEVGQTIFLKPIEGSNAWRRDKNIREVNVTKVGRKYVYIDRHKKFDIKSRRQVSDFAPDYTFFLTREDLDLEKESEVLEARLYSFVSGYKHRSLSLEDLRKICKICGLDGND